MEVFVLVPRKKSIVLLLLSSVVLALGAAALLLSCKNTILLPVACGLIFLWYFLQFRSNIEYEYSYFDGEIRFARVMNKSRRKALKSYTMSNVVQIAPNGDPSVSRYESDDQAKKKDYTSGKEGISYYDIVVKEEEGITVYKAELDDKFLDAICIKYASKVIRKH